jgi:hypothetical protein
MMIHASIGDLEFCDPIPAIRFVEIPASTEYDDDWKTRHGVYLIFYQDEPDLARVLEWVGMSADHEDRLAGRVYDHFCPVLMDRWIDRYSVSLL